MLELAAQLLVGHLEAHAVGLGDHGFLQDELVGRALQQDGHELLGKSARELLLDHVAGGHLDFLDGHFLVADSGEDTALRGSETECVTEHAAGNQGDDHGAANNDKDAAEDILLGLAGGLKKSNHRVLKAPNHWANLMIINQSRGWT